MTEWVHWLAHFTEMSALIVILWGLNEHIRR